MNRDALIHQGALSILGWGESLAPDYHESILEDVFPEDTSNEDFWQMASEAQSLAESATIQPHQVFSVLMEGSGDFSRTFVFDTDEAARQFVQEVRSLNLMDEYFIHEPCVQTILTDANQAASNLADELELEPLADPLVQVTYDPTQLHPELHDFVDGLIMAALSTQEQTDGGAEGCSDSRTIYAHYATTDEADSASDAVEALGLDGVAVEIYVQGGY